MVFIVTAVSNHVGFSTNRFTPSCKVRINWLYSILRTVVNYDFSLALNLDSRVAQARNRTWLLLAFAPCSRCPGLTQNFPIDNRSKYIGAKTTIILHYILWRLGYRQKVECGRCLTRPSEARMASMSCKASTILGSVITVF